MVFVVIECDRSSVEAVEGQLHTLNATDVRITVSDKPLDGWIQVFSIAASMSAIAKSALEVWILAKKKEHANINLVDSNVSASTENSKVKTDSI